MKPNSKLILLIFVQFVYSPIASCQSDQQTTKRQRTTKVVREPAFEKCADFQLNGKTNFENAAINLHEGQGALHVGLFTGENQYLSLDQKQNVASVIPLPGWKYPVTIPNNTKILAWQGETVGLLEPMAQQKVLATLPHLLEFGDLLLPAVSENGAFVCTRPTSNHIQIFHGGTGKPITPPIKQTGQVLQMQFTSDSKYLCTIASRKQVDGTPERKVSVPKVNPGNEGLKVWNSTTGDLVAGPLGSGIKIQHSGSHTTYDPVTERVVTVNHSESDNSARSSEIRIYPVIKNTTPITIELPSQISGVRWIDQSHLLVKGKRRAPQHPASLHGYDQNPMFVVNLKTAKPDFIEVAADTGFYWAIDSTRKYFATSVSTREGNFATCWKVGQTEPLWSRKGNFLAFGDQGWLVITQPGRHVEVCSRETGEVNISFDNVLETILNGDQFLLCKETNLEVWQQK
ncbi:MAG: hypothetical protein VYA84_03120 [Planctomycetota bacterium]|nr:hypothetical protein [Planctomycetota bacterium]